MTRVWLLAALVLALAACGPGDGAPSDSGIEGLVLIGPMCPVVQEGEPCPDEPFEAEIRVRKAGNGKVVTTVRSGKDGRFQVELAPGDYVLEPLSPTAGGPPYAGPVDVRVRAHRFTRLTISYDSGIR